MTPVQSFVNFADASTTLQQVTQAASPMFASTVQPAAFIQGVWIGGVVVAALIGAVVYAVRNVFTGMQSKAQEKSWANWKENDDYQNWLYSTRNRH